MLNKEYFSAISKHYWSYVHEVKRDNMVHLQDSSIFAEDFFRDFLNSLYGWSLRNANEKKPGISGYDLIDTDRKIIVQVSSKYDKKTIQDKLTKAGKHGLEGYRYYYMAITFENENASTAKSHNYTIPEGLLFDGHANILVSKDILLEAQHLGPDRQYELLKVTRKYSDKKKNLKTIATKSILALLAISLAVALSIFIIKRVENSTKALSDNLQFLFDGVNNSIAQIEKQPTIKGISEERAAISYKTGMASYNEHQYGSAINQFQEALAEQEIITGASSSEVGHVYCMIGLSKIYNGQSTEDDGDDALSALNRAIQIFKENGNTLDLARCYYYFGVAFFEAAPSELNRAMEQVKKSIDALDVYWPDSKTISTSAGDDVALQLLNHYYSDYKMIYRACNYYELLQKNYDLLGKIFFSGGDNTSALLYFNLALEANVYFRSSDYALATCDFSERIEIKEDEIKDYIKEKSVGSISEDSIEILLYSHNVGLDQIDTQIKKKQLAYCSADTATWLTNRAMSLLSSGYYIEAEEDCSAAITVWESLPFSSRANASYSYLYHAISQIGIASASKDSTAYLEEIKDELKNHADAAVTIDTGLWGPEHPRTAFSYETKASIYLALGENDIAIQDYQEAARIYETLGNREAAQFCQERKSEIEARP